MWQDKDAEWVLDLARHRFRVGGRVQLIMGLSSKKGFADGNIPTCWSTTIESISPAKLWSAYTHERLLLEVFAEIKAGYWHFVAERRGGG